MDSGEAQCWNRKLFRIEKNYFFEKKIKNNYLDLPKFALCVFLELVNLSASMTG